VSSPAADAKDVSGTPQLLFVEHDALERSAIATYLRECGYQVVEAVSAEEAQSVLRERGDQFDIAFIAVDLPGKTDGFALAKWIREHAAGTRVLLAATVEKAAKLAGDLCESGPHLRKPYQPQALLDWVKRLRAPRSD
jgi:CheY-like chemotaxis protein